MRVFILSTGRTGSTTIIEACKHITNYTASHESRSSMLGEERFNYPDNHIEADNRLSWFLGQLDKKFGDNAFYVHLKRDKNRTINSLNQRWNTPKSIVKAFANGILKIPQPLLTKADKLIICSDYYDCVNTNIDSFLKNKSKKQTITLESFDTDFIEFCNNINAEVVIDNALKDLNKQHNKTQKHSIRYLLYKLKLNLIRIRRFFLKK